MLKGGNFDISISFDSHFPSSSSKPYFLNLLQQVELLLCFFMVLLEIPNDFSIAFSITLIGVDLEDSGFSGVDEGFYFVDLFLT